MNSITQLIDRVTISSPTEFYAQVSDTLANGKKMFVVTANPEIIMNGKKNAIMNDFLRNRATIIPDGIGVAKAAQIRNSKTVERNTGIQLVEYLLEEANVKEYKVFIYGSKQNVLEDFMAISRKRWPNVSYSGVYNGYDNKSEDVLRLIDEYPADIYFIALGTPKQELFINQFFDSIDKGICVGVGGSFDVLSGHKKRAPEFLIKCNLEWMYRIATQPKRIGRFVKGNVIGFAFGLIKEWLEFKLGGNAKHDKKR